MSTKQTTIIQCDHVHESDGKQCVVERVQSKISPTEPMYHLTITLYAIGPDCAYPLVQEDVHLCYWDLYYHLSSYHDQAKADVERRKALAGQPLGLEQAI